MPVQFGQVLTVDQISHIDMVFNHRLPRHHKPETHAVADLHVRPRRRRKVRSPVLRTRRTAAERRTRFRSFSATTVEDNELPQQHAWTSQCVLGSLVLTAVVLPRPCAAYDMDDIITPCFTARPACLPCQFASRHGLRFGEFNLSDISQVTQCVKIMLAWPVPGSHVRSTQSCRA
jgi:hypothetical protein